MINLAVKISVFTDSAVFLFVINQSSQYIQSCQKLTVLYAGNGEVELWYLDYLDQNISQLIRVVIQISFSGFLQRSSGCVISLSFMSVCPLFGCQGQEDYGWLQMPVKSFGSGITGGLSFKSLRIAYNGLLSSLSLLALCSRQGRGFRVSRMLDFSGNQCWYLWFSEVVFVNFSNIFILRSSMLLSADIESNCWQSWLQPYIIRRHFFCKRSIAFRQPQTGEIQFLPRSEMLTLA